MRASPGYLVIGGDSLVGGGVFSALTRRGYPALATTRRRETVTASRVLLDFDAVDSFNSPQHVGYAFLIAAATSYDRCENDPAARITNVESIPRLVSRLLEQGLFVTFISTNTVFGGDREWPHEDSEHEPRIAYAVQKSEGEAVIRDAAARLGASDRLNIVRLTKILNATVSPLPAWVAAWRRGEVVQPFADLVFAPMSLNFVSNALVTLGEQRIPGNLHLSGAANVDYVTFAHALARRLGFAPSLIQPTTAVEKGVVIPYKPRFSGLGMTKTSELSGIQPQQLTDVVNDLAAELDGRSEGQHP